MLPSAAAAAAASYHLPFAHIFAAAAAACRTYAAFAAGRILSERFVFMKQSETKSEEEGSGTESFITSD